MFKKELADFVKQLAPYFGEKIKCEIISPEGDYWIPSKLEIDAHFISELEEGNIRNIQFPEQGVDIVKMAASNFRNIAEIAARLTPGNVSHDGMAILGIARRNADYLDKYTK